MVKQMFAPPGHDGFVPGETRLVDHTDGHDAATVVVRKPGKGTNTKAAHWLVHSRNRMPRNRLFFQYLNDSQLPKKHKYVEDGSRRKFTIAAEGNKGWWAQLNYRNHAAFTIPADLRFKLEDDSRAA